MPNEYEVGALVRVTGTFTDSNGAADPTAITLYVKDPSGSITELTYDSDVSSDIASSGTGVFYSDIDIDESGKWFYKFKGTGAVQAASTYWFTVKREEIST